jgi:hypothetical protein
MVATVAARSDPARTTVVVPFDPDPFMYYNDRLERPFRVVAYAHPEVPFHDAWTPEQLVEMFRAAQDSTRGPGDVWIVVRSPNSGARRQVMRMAAASVAPAREPGPRDSLLSVQGPLRFRLWRDLPEGARRRAAMVGDLMEAAEGAPSREAQRPVITAPFTRAELAANSDSIRFYVGKLRDPAFVEIFEHDGDQRRWYTAAEKLGSYGAASVPALMARLESDSDFERMQVVYALLLATQDERVLARTGGEYVNPGMVLDGSDSRRGAAVARAWWQEHGHFWTDAGVSAPAPATSFDTLRPAPRSDR